MTMEPTAEQLHAFLASLGDVDECIDRLTRSRQGLLLLLDGVDDDILFRREDPESWSAGMVAEHVARAEHSAGRAIRWLRRRAEGEDLKAPDPRPGIRRADGRPVSPDLVAPRGGISREELLAMLDSSRRLVIEVVAEGRTLLDAPFTLHHPFFGELTGLGWLRMAAYHEPHHLAQVRSLLRSASGAEGEVRVS